MTVFHRHALATAPLVGHVVYEDLRDEVKSWKFTYCQICKCVPTSILGWVEGQPEKEVA